MRVYVEVYNVTQNQLILDEISYYVEVFLKIRPNLPKINVVSIGHKISYENDKNLSQNYTLESRFVLNQFFVNIGKIVVT